ncbi:PREDICTED: cytochrome P450 4C1-like [Diuraphis noxia]|uniref:cytochrome P450 4C1-like n=1 Tax=Diuraphis noxia TaxID=143948 RepID=UPI0007636FCD|nr:PREDICTED: cytochrome P450 4C1-like [Diuraphis noxia]
MTIFLLLSSFLIFIILILIFSKCFYTRRSKEHYRMCAKLPSMPQGYLTHLRLTHKLSTLKPKDVLPFFDSILKQYGPLVHFHVLGHSYVLLNDPDDIKVLLSSSQHINKGPEYTFLKPWLNKGLLTSGNQKWHTRRKMLTYTFHFKILETYVPTFNKHAQCLAKKLENMASNDQRVSIYNHMTLCALDLVCDTIMGTELRSQEGESKEYVKAIDTVTDITINRVCKFWLWNKNIFNLSQNGRNFNKSLKILHTFTENVIKNKRAKLESVNCLEIEELSFGKKQVQSFLDLLIGISKQNPEKMTDLDIREEVDTFLFEGHDTSSTAITMAFIQLGLNQDIQDRVREELYSIFEDSDREATLADLKSMKYLDRVIKETLRLYPSVPSVTRMLKQHLHIREYEIPPDTVIVILPYLLHREEKHFPNPLTFDPDRFLPENSINRHPYAFIPFSAGPRNCIGQKFAMYQMKTVISTVIRKMRIETLGSQDDIKISTQLILRPESLPNIKLTKIK